MDHASAIATLEERRTLLQTEIESRTITAVQNETWAATMRSEIAVLENERTLLAEAIEELGGIPHNTTAPRGPAVPSVPAVPGVPAVPQNAATPRRTA